MRRALVITVAATLLALLFGWRLYASSPDGRFVDVSDGVLDQVTGLVWEKSDSGTTYTQANAVTHCTGLGGAWRLPKIDELFSLVDPRAASPALDPFFTFSATGGYVYWSQNLGSCLAAGNGYTVDFASGAINQLSKTDSYRARCVH